MDEVGIGKEEENWEGNGNLGSKEEQGEEVKGGLGVRGIRVEREEVFGSKGEQDEEGKKDLGVRGVG